MGFVFCSNSSGHLEWDRAFYGPNSPPDTILYNGKIVTVDDHEVNENVGTIAEALAIRGDTIVAVGDNAQVRALAGSNTNSIDLQGRDGDPGLRRHARSPDGLGHDQSSDRQKSDHR